MSLASSREGSIRPDRPIGGARDGYPTGFGAGELPELRLQPLDPESATRLLVESGDHLSAGERSRILREAAGNPLALSELPSVADRLHGGHLMPGLVPLTERLEQAFAARAADLPLETQSLLLVAALSDSESLSEVLRPGVWSRKSESESRPSSLPPTWPSSSLMSEGSASATR